jgi:hypothetical protein
MVLSYHVLVANLDSTNFTLVFIVGKVSLHSSHVKFILCPNLGYHLKVMIQLELQDHDSR